MKIQPEPGEKEIAKSLEVEPARTSVFVGRAELKPQELKPQEWATKDELREIPPRRTGFNVILLISGLVLVLVLGLYAAMVVCGSDSNPLILEYTKLALSAETTEVSRALAKEALEKIIEENRASRDALFDYSEKLGLALISLLSAVVGYTLKGESSPKNE